MYLISTLFRYRIDIRLNPLLSPAVSAFQESGLATILDVARKAQVAPSTVSLVTNNRGYVSPATRQRVEAAIRQLKYKARGSGQRTARSHLALIYTPASRAMAIAPIALQCIEGIQVVMTRQRSRPSLIAAHAAGRDPIFLQSLESRQFDGAIIVGASAVGDHYAGLLATHAIPTVMVNRLLAGNPASAPSTVTADFRQGGYLATSALIRRGHCRIGFVGLDAEHWPSAQRLEGHRQALEEHGLPEGPNLLLPSRLLVEFDHQELPESDPPFIDYCQQRVREGYTAFAIPQRRAQAFLRVMAGMGLSVPEDVSLVSFDGPVASDAQALPLDRVDYDKHYLGELAAETLQELIRNRDQCSRLFKAVQTRYIPGASVSAPPAGCC